VATRLTTGLGGLDAQLGGGIPPGTVHVLLGEPMNALELFCYHFAVGAGAGATAHYIATSMTEEEVALGIDGIGGASKKVKIIALEGNEPPAMAKGTRYILDSFSEYAAAAGWEKALKKLRMLKEQARQSGNNLLIVVIAGLHTDREIALLKLWADGVLEIGLDRQGFGLYPFLKVTKMRGVPDSSRFLLFKETEKGLFMESTRRVF
jgi:archaeal flagellar protein FlaH